MKNFLKNQLLAIIFLTAVISNSYSQPKMIDRVVAVVGDFMILQSDIETQYRQVRDQGVNMPDLRCMIFRDLMEQKLLLNQAKVDSIEVSESQVERELDQRLEVFIAQIGSQEELEAYFGKPVIQIKEDFRQDLRQMIITRQMQDKITSDINITPSEVKKFYNSIPEDSIPYIDAQVEVQQIVKYPPLGEDAVFEVKERLLELRKRILEGESFETLAILYSEGPSASEGGEIGFMGRGELDPEYAKAAFSLKEGGISKIVESEFGFHIIQLIERKEDRINTRHILMKPRISTDARRKAIKSLDSLLTEIRQDSITFGKAAFYHSEDKKTALNEGLVVNPRTNSSKFELNNLDTKDYLAVRDMKPGQISDPYEAVDENGKVIYKVIRLKSRTDPHQANLDQDYMLIKNLALQNKMEEKLQEWLKEKRQETYIKIDSAFRGCAFIQDGWLTAE